ncbi:TlpA family protein disulfide reductase (plasmid) [Rhizobium ruizarguesonis]|uniref:TlpA disulfide reductase family protein n=1 Tax=Rhizobium ruizarguesonis TaxID=2081791 RepID=UPI001030CA37|nr:TlpA disulfide reductase family protein [Rhizobium ruizarguesonis]TAW61437.1 TlpA family protein disulfide reductase [Rhizobium ruizarguesonis]
MNAHFLIGSLAPSIETLTWIRGNPIFALERGKIHIVALFATTCGFCSKSLADLGQLQEKYRDIGLEALGVAARERVATADEARARVDTWLNKELPNPTIPIAFEHTGEMNKLWWVAGGSFADPTIFVVDRDNSIAHIGYPDPEDPDLLERVLIKVMDGSWDTSAEAKNAQEKWLEGVLLFRAIAAVNIKDFQTALSTIEEGIKAIPDNLPFREAHVELLLGRMHDFEAGWIVLARLARNAIEKNDGEWLLAAMQQLFGSPYDYSCLPFAERFSMGKELLESIQTLCPQQDGISRARSYATIAPYFYESGDKDRAVESIAHALELVEGESLPDDVKQEYLAQLEAALAEYKG